MGQPDAIYLFGPFHYDSRNGQLFRDQRHLPLQARTTRILALFLERPGEVILKEEIMELVWPERIIEDNTLTHHISNLRRILGDDLKSLTYILTIPGKGYLFNYPVKVLAPDDPALPFLRSTLSPQAIESGKEQMEGEPAKRLPRVSAAFLTALLLGGIGVTSLLWWGLTVLRSPSGAPSSAETIVTWLPLVTFPGIERQPAFSPDGRQVVFSSPGDSSENIDLYLKEFPAGPLRQLTSDPRRDHSPVWSSDGRQIAFLRDSIEATGPTLLVILSLESQIEEAVGQLVEAHGLGWSPDGSQFVVSENRPDVPVCGLSLLTLRETAGRREAHHTARLTDAPDIHGHHQPNFSPDGRWVAFIRSASNVNGDLYLLNLANRQLTQLTNDQAEIYDLEWSADGKSLFFVSSRSGERQLWRIEADGANPTQMEWLPGAPREFSISPSREAMVMTQSFDDSEIILRPLARRGSLERMGEKEGICQINSTQEEHSVRFSPDGQTLVYVSDQSGSMELWLANADCTDQRQLTRLRSASLGSPRWSPDGSIIAFDHHEGGNPHIFTIATQTGTVHQITVDESKNIIPSWSADGKSIYFTSRREGVLQCRKIPLAGGPSVLLSSSECLEPVESPDGKTLYFTRVNQLWTRNLLTGEETPIPELRQQIVARHWQLTRGGLFFSPVGDSLRARLMRLDLRSREVEQIDFLEGPFFQGIPGIPRFSISPDEKRIASYRVVYHQGDILFSENLSQIFRGSPSPSVLNVKRGKE
jgi:Tol biopolymer transport system component/DNA-binding winged helix-turn-helix (wHTH) protein